MKVLLSGATGFLGTIILNYLEKLGHEVDTIGRSDKNTIKADLATFNTPITTTYDLVIHAAGKAHTVPKNPKEEKLFYDVNLEGTKNLLKNLTKSPSKFVFISTVAVYGKDYGIAIKEDHPLNANTPYGKSKVLAENEILMWARENGIATTILRLPLIIGHNPKGNLKNMVNAIKKGFYFNVGKGDAKKSMILVDDVAQAIPILIEHPDIYHLTDGHDPSFKEISQVIGKHLGVKKILSLNYFLVKPLALLGDLIGIIFSRNAPIDSNKLNKITNDLTFDDSKSRAAGWISKKVLENQNLWLN